MANDRWAIPSDQFERVIDEMRSFANLLDEQERHVSTARGINTVEARRAFSLSSARLQEAGFWFQQALAHARAASAALDDENRNRKPGDGKASN